MGIVSLKVRKLNISGHPIGGQANFGVGIILFPLSREKKLQELSPSELEMPREP